jgi:hypothetical protein
VTDNRLAGGELKNLAQYTELKVIKFGNNLVKSLDELKALVSIVFAE